MLIVGAICCGKFVLQLLSYDEMNTVFCPEHQYLMYDFVILRFPFIGVLRTKYVGVHVPGITG